MTKQEKINAIIDAARELNFSDSIDDINLIEYYDTDTDGNTSTYEDIFYCFDLTTIPVSICVLLHCSINEKHKVPITKLTDASIDRLFDCIIK